MMEQDTEITVEYTEAIIRNAAKRFLVRFAVRDTIIGILFALFSLGAYLGTDVDWRLCAVLGGVGIGFVILMISLGFFYIRSSAAKFRAMRDPKVRWRFTHVTLGTRSELGSTEISWRMISDVWCFPEVWLVFFGKQGYGYSTLPTAGLNIELKEFILAKVGTHSGKSP